MNKESYFAANCFQ